MSPDHCHRVFARELTALQVLSEGAFGEVLKCTNNLFGQIAVKFNKVGHSTLTFKITFQLEAKQCDYVFFSHIIYTMHFKMPGQRTYHISLVRSISFRHRKIGDNSVLICFRKISSDSKLARTLRLRVFSPVRLP